MKISLMGAKLFHADTHGELSIRFSQFCEKRLKHYTQFGYISQKIFRKS
jgi:hypothetical protein